MKILHLTTHVNIGGITSYIAGAGGAMTDRGHSISVLSSGGNFEEGLRERKLTVINFPIRTKNELNPKVFLQLPQIIRLVKEEHFDLLHAHTRVTQVLAAVVSFFTKVPCVTTAHGYYRPRFGRRLFACWGRRVVAVSPLVAEDLEKVHHVAKSKIRVIFNALDIPSFRRRLLANNAPLLRKEFGIPEKAFVIGSVSRLVRDKGHEYLVEAAAKIKKRHPQIFLLIVGDGRERKMLEKKIARTGLSKQAAILPSQPEITGILSTVDVFAHPATFREGFGLALLEAMAAKIPIVTTDIWAINSIVRDRVNGFLVPPKDAPALAEALNFVIEHPDFAEQVAQNAFQMASQLYSMDRLVNELETVYTEVLNERKSSAAYARTS